MVGTILPVLLVAACLGGLTGLRTFTPLTVLAWELHLRRMSILGSNLSFLHTTAAVVLLTILALGELTADKLPRTPSRLQAPGMLGRSIFGVLCGMVAAQAWGGNWETCALTGLVGAAIGALLGYKVRTSLARRLRCPDFAMALAEDAVAIGGSLLVVGRAIRLPF
jgi:uncharacterized membrane protein